MKRSDGHRKPQRERAAAADHFGVAYYSGELQDAAVSRKSRQPVSSHQPFGHNPFEALSNSLTGLPSGPELQPATTAPVDLPQPPRRNRGRVDIVREKAHRGGKVVTVIKGFMGIGLTEKQDLARKIQKASGSGGTVKDGRIEIQGDQRDAAARILEEAGFRPVFAGG